MPRPHLDPPCFDSSVGPRVVIEAGEWATREVLGAILRDAGYSVGGCAGPGGSDDRCPLVAEGACTAIADADVVVHALRHSDPRNREVLLQIRRRHPDLPIVVEVPPARVAEFADDFDGCIVVPYPATEATLLAAVERALA